MFAKIKKAIRKVVNFFRKPVIKKITIVAAIAVVAYYALPYIMGFILTAAMAIIHAVSTPVKWDENWRDGGSDWIIPLD